MALYIVKLACERPDDRGRSLSQWDCPELARKLKADGVVQTISPETVGRILRSHKLKPWRHHLWLSAKVPRDDHFAQLVHTLVELYTRPLSEEEMVVCVDEKTNLQPRPRLAATLSARPGQPIRLANEYKRVGALHLFAAFDTRTSQVYARTERRRRQVEFIALLTQLDREIPPLRAYPNNPVRYFSVRQSIVNRFVLRACCSCVPFPSKGRLVKCRSRGCNHLLECFALSW